MNASGLYSKSSLRIYGCSALKPEIIATIYLVSISLPVVQ